MGELIRIFPRCLQGIYTVNIALLTQRTQCADG